MIQHIDDSTCSRSHESFDAATNPEGLNAVPRTFMIRTFYSDAILLRSIYGLVLLCLSQVSLSLLSTAAADDPAAKQLAAELRLTIPRRCYAVAGQPLSILVDDVILTQASNDYRLHVSIEHDGTWGSVGVSEPRGWSFTPENSHVGTHPIRITLTGPGERQIDERMSALVVAPSDAGRDRQIALLIVGDSLTHASLYPNSLARLLTRDGNPQWKMLGTHRPSGAADGVFHEGYGGWTWDRFANHFVPDGDSKEPKLRGSPFVFADSNGKPQLNPAQYFDQRFNGQRPDTIVFLLGINDCFSAPPDHLPQIDERIDAVFLNAEKLLKAMRMAAPKADLVVCTTPPPNSRQGAFEANYKDRYTRWGWKRIQHRLVERQIKQFDGRDAEQIFLVPTELNVDPIEGYPENNGVHPNATGYQQIADSIYAWLKCRMAQPPK